MGRYYEHTPTGKSKCFVACNSCNVLLGNDENMESTNFRSGTGSAMLFSNVVNVEFMEPTARVLITGRHVTSTINCARCHQELGWFYDLAFPLGQEYKEGKFILEQNHVHRVHLDLHDSAWKTSKQI